MAYVTLMATVHMIKLQAKHIVIATQVITVTIAVQHQDLQPQPNMMAFQCN